MQLKDLDQVMSIEKASYPTPWSRYAFLNELRDNQFAHYYVLEGPRRRLLGYAGMWIVLEEAHITNVAVHPEHRGQQLGRTLLQHLMDQAVALGATRMTLEVRVSNEIARDLYLKMGFTPAGVRKGYYIDTREDAIIMWRDLPVPGRLNVGGE